MPRKHVVKITFFLFGLRNSRPYFDANQLSRVSATFVDQARCSGFCQRSRNCHFVDYVGLGKKSNQRTASNLNVYSNIMMTNLYSAVLCLCRDLSQERICVRPTTVGLFLCLFKGRPAYVRYAYIERIDIKHMA
jgi:hypothetical protein